MERPNPKVSFNPEKPFRSLPLQYSVYYHIYNRGNNRESIFKEKRNYDYFFRLYQKYIDPIALTLAYCLLCNHFHCLVKIKRLEEIQSAVRIPAAQINHYPSLQFGHLFNAYTKAFNKTYRRTGSLFEKPFRRIPVTSDAHFTRLIAYIHRNPEKHRLADDFRTWPYSSYPEIHSLRSARVAWGQVLELFGNLESFTEYHLKYGLGSETIDYLVSEDD